MKLFGPVALEEMSFEAFSIFSSSGHLVQPSGTISAILVEGTPRNIPVKLFQNPFIGDVF